MSVDSAVLHPPVLTVIQLDDEVPLDRFADWLTVDHRIIRADLGEHPGPIEDCDGLLVLGGGMSVDDGAVPCIAETRSLLADAVRAGVPTLCLCLGAQLLAEATGGQVQVAAPPGLEAGAVELRWRPEAARDRLVGALAGRSRAAVMPTLHSDAVVDLPRAGVWLASSPTYPYQAFRVGSAWGLQFHPEASPELVMRWAVLDGLDSEQSASLAAETRAVDEAVCRDGRELAEAFSAVIRNPV